MIEEQGDEFHDTIERALLPKLTSTEQKFLKEFVHVMAPVALALDILQRDKNMYIGYLLPTVNSLRKGLQKVRTLDGQALKYCDPLARTLRDALDKPRRFKVFIQLLLFPEIKIQKLAIPFKKSLFYFNFGNFICCKQAYQDDDELSLAAVLIPTFKLNWIDDPQRRQEVKDLLLSEMKNVEVSVKPFGTTFACVARAMDDGGSL